MLERHPLAHRKTASDAVRRHGIFKGQELFEDIMRIAEPIAKDNTTLADAIADVLQRQGTGYGKIIVKNVFGERGV